MTKTPDALQTQYAKNAAQLQTMLETAERTGRTVNGFTADNLRESVRIYTHAASSPEAARETLAAGLASASARLKVLREA